MHINQQDIEEYEEDTYGKNEGFKKAAISMIEA